jgi:hypothetical protein
MADFDPDQHALDGAPHTRPLPPPTWLLALDLAVAVPRTLSCARACRGGRGRHARLRRSEAGARARPRGRGCFAGAASRTASSQTARRSAAGLRMGSLRTGACYAVGVPALATHAGWPAIIRRFVIFSPHTRSAEGMPLKPLGTWVAKCTPGEISEVLKRVLGGKNAGLPADRAGRFCAFRRRCRSRVGERDKREGADATVQSSPGSRC